MPVLPTHSKHQPPAGVAFNQFDAEVAELEQNLRAILASDLYRKDQQADATTSGRYAIAAETPTEKIGTLTDQQQKMAIAASINQSMINEGRSVYRNLRAIVAHDAELQMRIVRYVVDM